MSIRLGTEVARALAGHRPVLALESTIITHGLPRPRNVEVARATEAAVREAGVTPATIGVVGGDCVVGLSDAELERLALDESCVKLSIRDLPIAAALGLSGGTTVAATATLAHRAGIKVFSTGGLGGVHRGASHTFDESADLPSLAATPLVLVSAGVKSILDVGATLERLETLSIPVLGWRTRAYPGFYIADSGFTVDYQVDTPEQVAAVAAARDALGLSAAVLVANPLPPEHQLDRALHDRALAAGLAEVEARGVRGHDVTPFLLDYMQRHTGGESLEANLAAYRGNVDLGARIAAAIAGA
ncbi:MAG: pseudouridine-5'-phosphate glycosidase [Actinomycetia bacterium]|nr:pseudouridine-5'-phosphate glycosidase [Actinomycetes bacterium]